MDPEPTHPDPAGPSEVAPNVDPHRTVTTHRRKWRSWLRREPRTPEPSIVKVMAEWAEYQMVFNDILTRLSAQLARQAKMEKRRLERISEAVPSEIAPPAPTVSPKAQLRSMYAAQRFGGRVQALLEAKEGNGEPHGESG